GVGASRGIAHLNAQVVMAESHPHRFVPALFHPHRGAAQPRTNIRAGNLVAALVVLQGVIMPHPSFLHMTQDGGQIMRPLQASMPIRGVRRVHRKTTIPQRQVLLLQILPGLFQVAHPRLAQSLHQAVLRRPKESFHAPLGLWRVGRYPADPQLPQRSPDLCPSLGPSLVLRPTRRTIYREQTVLVRVEVYRPTPRRQVISQQEKVFFRRVVLGKTRPRLARGIINHRQEVQLGSPPFHPVVMRGIPMYQLPPASSPRPPHMDLLDSPSLPFPHPRLDQQLPQRLLADLYPVLLRQVLGRQRRPKIPILPLHQLYRFLPHRFRNPPLRGPPP